MPFSLRPINATDESTVFDIFKRSPQYFLRVEGRAPDEEILRNEIDGKPKKLSPEYSKEFLLILQSEVPIGVIDLHLHHPEKHIAYIGLFLLVEELHGRGMGTDAFQALEAYSKDKDIQRIRLGVSDDNNDVSPFWSKLGFAPNGNAYDFQGVNRVTHSIEYEKAIHI